MSASALRLSPPVPTPSGEDAPQLIKLPEVCRRTGLHRNTIQRLMARGNFPKPIKIGRASRWAARLVQAWIEDRITASER